MATNNGPQRRPPTRVTRGVAHVPAIAITDAKKSVHSDRAGPKPRSVMPDFTATALTGEKVSAAQLIGQPTILIVTPSKDAAKNTRLWAE